MASVLVVDDEEGIRSFAATTLLLDGHQVEEAGTVRDAQAVLTGKCWVWSDGVATASAEATAAGTLAKVGLAGLLKWVGIGVIGGAAMVGVVETVAPQAAPVSRAEIVEPPRPRTPSEHAPTVKEQAPAPPVASEEVVSAEPSPQAARSQELGASTTSLADEVRALDGARKALAGGNARACLEKLDSYRAEFPRGVLGLEATVLRIEALAASGARTQARDLGTRFLESHPDSAHAARVRSVIGAETIP